MALIFCIVVTHELLFARTNLNPVAILYGSGITGTLLLLLHLCLKLLLVYRQTTLATDKFCQVERETIGIEKAESLCSVEFCLAFCLYCLDSGREHIDTV